MTAEGDPSAGNDVNGTAEDGSAGTAGHDTDGTAEDGSAGTAGHDTGGTAEDDNAGTAADDADWTPGDSTPDREGYVHDPGETRPHQAPPAAEFDWRGWVLVGVVVVVFLVVPTAIIFLPQARGVVASLGLTLRDAYLVLPLIPAFLLGATAVWAAVRARSE